MPVPQRLPVLVLLLVGLLLQVSPIPGAFAYTQEDARITLHVKPVTTKFICTPASMGGYAPNDTPCSEFRMVGPVGVGHTVYLLTVGDATRGFLGAGCGIEYDPVPGSGVDVFGWTSCVDTQAPMSGPNGVWPASGSANRMIFSFGNCQSETVPGYENEGAHVTLGAFYTYAYGPDVLEVSYNLNVPAGEFDVVDCAAVGSVLPPSAAGSVSFVTSGQASVGGCNPCLGPCAEDPVCETTATELVFGPMRPKQRAIRRVDVTNVQGQRMLGSVQLEACNLGLFLRLNTPGRYSLLAGESQAFKIEFVAPVLPGTHECILDMGPLCPDVTLTLLIDDDVPVERVSWGGLKARWGTKH